MHDIFKLPVFKLPLTVPEGLRDRMLGIEEMRQVWRRAMRRGNGSIHERVLAELELRLEATGNLHDIPKQGPLVVVANHPFGIVEGPTLGALLDRVRPDVMFVTNSLLAQLPELRSRIFAVNPFGDAAHENTAAIRHALRHLRQGGALVVFPAGEVSAMRAPWGLVGDASWQPMAARLAIRTGAKVVPVHFAGRNRGRFQLAGLVHPKLRTMMLPSEMLSRRRKTVRLAVGPPVEAARHRNAEEFTRQLRAVTYALPKQQPVAPSPGKAALSDEISRLAPAFEAGAYQVYLEPAARIPVALEEIARLREITFRSVGEGTGRAKDLDEFDSRYWHIFVWHREAQEIAGAYRVADVAEAGRVYCETLFRFPRQWNGIASRGAELGRSFIRDNYQRDFLPLLLLWKGIGRFVLDRPHIRYLFGPVSVSANYTPAARALIASFFEWRSGILPRNPLTLALWRPWRGERDFDLLGKQVSQLEPEGRGLPVLLRQYVNLGGEILCMNLDSHFGNSLDGLVLLDLQRVPPRMMERYFGAEGVRRYSANIPTQ
jgi:putative hemolysin